MNEITSDIFTKIHTQEITCGAKRRPCDFVLLSLNGVLPVITAEDSFPHYTECITLDVLRIENALRRPCSSYKFIHNLAILLMFLFITLGWGWRGFLMKRGIVLVPLHYYSY